MPDTPELIAGQMRNGPAQALAVAVEQARLALARGEAPGEETKRRFLDALCRLIRDAMREQGGDPGVSGHGAPAPRRPGCGSTRRWPRTRSGIAGGCMRR
ncbi:hypothetical protein AD428_04750 [Achromobacter sp. DMS1]|nr:hypothetical protein AD428_04750 [Achromobacter sp. DMS1]